MALEIAGRVSEVARRLDIPYVFKGSYRKANRSRLDSFMGIGDLQALEILKKVKDTYGIPVVTDIHSAEEAAMAEPVPQPQDELPFQPGAGLYDEPAAEKPARKTARKSSTGKRSTRKPKAAAEPQEELSSPAFDNFEGVDFDS